MIFRRQTGLYTALVSIWLLAGAVLQLRAADPAVAPPPAPAAVPQRIERAGSPIHVDGVLDEAAWQTATRYEIAYEVYPGKNSASPVRTEVWVTYDDHHLYVAFHAHDPHPTEIRAHFGDRDSSAVFNDDFVGFAIDPNNDGRRGFKFLINPRGVQADCIVDDVNGGESCSDFDALWDSAGKLTGDGYVVEAAVPFSSLRFQRGEGEQTWGFFPMRIYPRSKRMQLWPVAKNYDASCDVCQYLHLTGFSGISPGRNLEFDPTFTASRSDSRSNLPADHLAHGPGRGEVGLTARWGITPNITWSGAWHPDFSQVEADSPQLTINTRYALYYDEKRPFFLEGTDFFSTPISAVYTRTIADPEWGTKLTGKEGKNAFGLVVARDQLTNLLFPASQYSDLASLDQPATSVIARYRRDVGTGSNLGVLLTSRQGDGYFNRLFGLDGTVRISDTDSVRFQLLRSITRYPDAIAAVYAQLPGRFTGGALNINYSHDSRNWHGWGSYEDDGKDFRADTGFIPQVDARNVNGGLNRVFWGGPDRPISRWSLGVNTYRTEDHAGLRLGDGFGIFTGLQGPHQSNANLNLSSAHEYYSGTDYSLRQLFVFFAIRPSGAFGIRMSGSFGDQIDYANGRAGKIARLQAYTSFNFGSHLALNFNHTYERLTVAGGSLYTANLSNLRLACQFSLRAFVRLTLHGSDLNRDPALYTFPVTARRRSLRSEFLFSYKINPQTLFLAGYNDGRSAVAPNPLAARDRTFFLKFGYAWVL